MDRLLFLFGDLLIIFAIVWIFLVLFAFFMKSKRFSKLYAWMLPSQSTEEPKTYNPTEKKTETQEPKP